MRALLFIQMFLATDKSKISLRRRRVLVDLLAIVVDVECRASESRPALNQKCLDIKCTSIRANIDNKTKRKEGFCCCCFSFSRTRTTAERISYSTIQCMKSIPLIATHKRQMCSIAIDRISI